ncbi:MAG: hypothetical protein JNL95_09655 [Chitinophagales bacterium]|nr:hypothetical protein [Chitinophagales bacterium]
MLNIIWNALHLFKPNNLSKYVMNWSITKANISVTFYFIGIELMNVEVRLSNVSDSI